MTKETLYRLVDLKEGEEKAVGLFIGYSFFMGVAVAIFYTATTSLFLHSFEKTMLPKAYIVGGLMVYVLGWFTSYIQKKVRFSSLVSGLIYFLMISVTGLLLCYQFSDIKWFIFFLFIWNRIFVFVNGITFWSTASRIFNLQQGKRLFGLISAGEVISSILSYFSVPLLLRFLATDQLLYLAAGAVVACIFLMSTIVARYKNELSGVGSEVTFAEGKDTRTWKDFLQNPYYVLLFLVAMMPVVGLFFVDFMFAIESKNVFPDNELLASFLGVFFGFCALVEISIKTALYGKLIRRFGLKLAISLLPLTLLFSVTLAVGYGMFNGTTALFFAFIVLSRFFMSSVRKSIHEPSFQLLLQPIMGYERAVLQSRIEGGPKAIGNIVPGLLLLLLTSFSFVGMVEIAAFFLLILIVWYYLSLKIQVEYRNVLGTLLEKSQETFQQGRDLYAQIGRRIVRDKKAPILNYEGSNFDFIVKLAASSRVPDRILAAELLRESGRYFAYRHLIALINDPDCDVKKAALLAAGEIRKPELWPLLINHLATDRFHQSAAYALISVGEPVVRELSRAFTRSGGNTTVQLRLLRILRQIGGPSVLKFLRSVMNYPDVLIRDEVFESLKCLSYHVNSTERSFIASEIEDRIALLVWIMASQRDLEKYPPWSPIHVALDREKRRLIPKLFTLLSLLPGVQSFDFISEKLLSDDEETYGYLLEVMNMTLPEEWKNNLIMLFEDKPLSERLRQCEPFYPHANLSPEERLKNIINRHFSRISCWLKVMALDELTRIPGDHTLILAAHAISPDEIMAETSLYTLHRTNRVRFDELQAVIQQQKDSFHSRIIFKVESSPGNHDLMIHKVWVLRQTELMAALHEDELLPVACSLFTYKTEEGPLPDFALRGQHENFVMVMAAGSMVVSWPDGREQILETFDTLELSREQLDQVRIWLRETSEIYCIDGQKINAVLPESFIEEDQRQAVGEVSSEEVL